MIIRQATIADLDAVTEVERICFPPLEAAPRSSYEKRLAAFSDSYLLAEKDGEVIGFVGGCVTDSRVIFDEMFHDTSHHKPEGCYQSIFSLAVIPEYRGCGVAIKLMEDMIELTRSRGKKGLILTCKEVLINYYSAFGYENLGISGSNHGGAVWYDMIIEF